MLNRDPRFPHKQLIIGVFFFLIGIGILLINTNVLPRLRDTWPIGLILVGLFLLYLVYVKNSSEGLIFVGMVLSLLGLSNLLQQSFGTNFEISRIWPVYMCIFGISILPYASKLKRSKSIVLIIPSIGLILLSILFLPFSLGIAGITFFEFVKIWWPIIFVLLGIFLMIEFKKKGNQ